MRCCPQMIELSLKRQHLALVLGEREEYNYYYLRLPTTEGVAGII